MEKFKEEGHDRTCSNGAYMSKFPYWDGIKTELPSETARREHLERDAVGVIAWRDIAAQVLAGVWDHADGSTMKSLLYGLKSPSLMDYPEVNDAIGRLSDKKPTTHRHGKISKRRRR